MRLWVGTGLVVLIAAAFSGCSRSESFDVAPVKGRVLSDGKLVSEGIVQFAPDGDGKSNKPGKSAAGVVNENGEFVLSTYREGDGAVIGKGKLTAGSSDPLKPWPAELTVPIDYDVKPEGNEIVIEVSSDGTGKVSSTGG